MTRKAQKGFVYDRFSVALLREFQYEGEGWGLTHDDTQLIMSDGTSYLRFLDPKSFREIKRVHVADETGHAIDNLNELEYIHLEYLRQYLADQQNRPHLSANREDSRMDRLFERNNRQA